MTEWTADPSDYQRDAAFVSDLAGDVLRLLDPRPGESILDLGCGDGRIASKLVKRGCDVVGIDASPAMVEAAQARGIDARLADAQQLDIDGKFDAVFSNAALHWMPDAEAVVAGVHSLLSGGGRFVAEFGGFGNVAAIRVALEAALSPSGLSGPDWYFPTKAAYRHVLERHGFTVDAIDLVPRQTMLPAGLQAWLEVFAGAALDPLPPRHRDRVVGQAKELLAPVLRDDSGAWYADYVRLRFHATRLRA